METEEITTGTEFENLTTDELVTDVVERVEILIGWAEADYEGSIESGAKAQASDDKKRVKNLKKALVLLNSSYKTF
jgi:hypothetical protein